MGFVLHCRHTPYTWCMQHTEVKPYRQQRSQRRRCQGVIALWTYQYCGLLLSNCQYLIQKTYIAAGFLGILLMYKKYSTSPARRTFRGCHVVKPRLCDITSFLHTTTLPDCSGCNFSGYAEACQDQLNTHELPRQSHSLESERT